MKIDVFNHLFPVTFFEKMLSVAPNMADIGRRMREVPAVVDLDVRFRIMDRFDDYAQIICLPAPPIEALGKTEEQAVEMAQIANDSQADYVRKYPDRFPGFIASLPMNYPDAALREIDRAVKDLKAVGVQLFTNVLGKPLDLPEYRPVFEKMAEYDLPILIHPARGAGFPDYPTEEKSKYEIWWALGWPYESSVAMARIVFAGYFDQWPNLKIVTHHLGAMIPYFEGRVGPGWDQLGCRTSDEDYSLVLKRLKKRPLDYFKMFLADTALFGATAATRCGLEFFGVDQVLFATDCPFDPEKGPANIRETIRVIEALDLSPEEKYKIYEGNARKYFKL